MKKPMIRWLGVGVLCGMLSVAQATIQEDLEAGLSPLEAVQNALEEGVPPGDIALQLIDAGFEPASAATLVVKIVPAAAVEVAKTVSEAEPEAAPQVAESVSEIVPEAAEEINRIVVATLAPPTTPNTIVAEVQENTPATEGAVGGSFQIVGLIDSGETTQDGKTVFIVTNPTTNNPTEWQVIVNEADDNSLIIVEANDNPTNERIDIINNLPEPASAH